MSGDAVVPPPGLAECRQMDEQLATVASASFQDIADRQVLLDEVLCCVDYLKLLVRLR
ncbi:hypothetical protein RvY_00311 [Ramazzottius varieornatus]|uniref:Uncharacterized protein n=1 Tax=Ramazzottius varieornatus TaxID=947166 RepID=A0A1D1UCT8_RAMVA|nr:hypothetical protein RvY_00311 [Ramazzottius varieornatus]